MNTIIQYGNMKRVEETKNVYSHNHKQKQCWAGDNTREASHMVQCSHAAYSIRFLLR